METGRARLTADDFDRVYSGVQERLGTISAFPDVCNAWGVEYGDILTPRSAWRHLHSAEVMLQETAALQQPRIVEVGGGFGGVAYWTHRLRPNAVQYAIYDFPVVNAIAGYFLIRALPETPVILNGEEPTTTAHIAVWPNWRIVDEPELGPDIAFNQDSIPEMPREAARRYLDVIDHGVRVAFYSENQENAQPWNPRDPTTAQLRLPEIEDSMTRLRLAARHRAWMRRGYFETFYRPRST
jgi:hypothetical protein